VPSSSAIESRPVSGRIQGLDVLRGIAILLVLLRHAWPDLFGGAGIVGVVMFFALSGYLITGILVGDIGKYGRIRYGRFYRNRALRLIPPLLFMLAGLAVISLTFDPLDDRSALLRTVLVGLTYTSNIPHIHGSPAIGHLWTLATEEQFYLVWPLLLSLGLRLRVLRWFVIAAGCGLYLVCWVSLLLVAPHYGIVYTLPTSWAVSMVIGAAACLSQRHWEPLVSSRRRLVGMLGAVGITGLLAISLLPDLKDSALAYSLFGPLIATLSVLLIVALRTWQTVPLRAMLPLFWLGTISYAAYLWDYPIDLWLRALLPGALVPLLSIAATVAAATISWFAIERPVMAWRRRLDERRRVIVGLGREGPLRTAHDLIR
jgi:peptidoglycan/LPS O-acetylase OafA/YrhL